MLFSPCFNFISVEDDDFAVGNVKNGFAVFVSPINSVGGGWLHFPINKPISLSSVELLILVVRVPNISIPRVLVFVMPNVGVTDEGDEVGRRFMVEEGEEVVWRFIVVEGDELVWRFIVVEGDDVGR